MKFWQAAISTAVLMVTTNANAALVGRLAITDGGTDYQAYYDTESDLTWLTDATGGTLSAWLPNLDVSGITGWRAPKNNNTNCSSVNCTDSELGNLFYNVLGGVAFTPLESTHNDNYYLFDNIQDSLYYSWPNYSSTIYWVFDMHSGRQLTTPRITNGYIWAVHDGDVGVSAVPVPAAVWLFGSGLIGLAGLAKRKEKT